MIPLHAQIKSYLWYREKNVILETKRTPLRLFLSVCPDSEKKSSDQNIQELDNNNIYFGSRNIPKVAGARRYELGSKNNFLECRKNLVLRIRMRRQ